MDGYEAKKRLKDSRLGAEVRFVRQDLVGRSVSKRMKQREGEMQTTSKADIVSALSLKESFADFLNQNLSHFILGRNLTSSRNNSSEDSVFVAECFYNLFHTNEVCRGVVMLPSFLVPLQGLLPM